MTRQQFDAALDTARRVLTCVLLITGGACLWSVHTAIDSSPQWATEQIQREGDATRKAALEAIEGTRKDVLGEVAALRKDVMSRVDAISGKVDARTGQALAIVADTESDARGQIVEIRGDLNRQLTALNGTAATTAHGLDALTARYTTLPDQLAVQLAPSWASIQPEITCRHLDGTGYGGCWHSRVTGLFGEAEKVGGVFTQQFPAFATSTNGIALDFHKLADKTLAPRGFWGKVGEGLNTGSVLVRALGAAGVF